MTNVLADRHHAGLWHSLQLLAKRLDWNLWTPLQQAWWDEGYWNFGRKTWGDDRLARQFLAIDQGIPGPNGLGRCDPEFPDDPIQGIGLTSARRMQWDVVMTTLDDNQAGFHRFAQEVGAKYAVHVGNTNQYVDWSLDPLVLNASEMPGGIHIGEEFDSDGTFGSRPIVWETTDAYTNMVRNRIGVRTTSPDRIGSFVNCMTSIACYPILQEAQRLLPEFGFIVGGIDGPDGVTKPIDRLADVMRSCGWAWHDKQHGDGYGHVLHYWAAIGRPLIGHASHYAGKNGAVFWRDLETCIDLDKHTLPEAVALIKEISNNPARHEAMCKAIRRIFDETTDWAGDAEKVRQLLA